MKNSLVVVFSNKSNFAANMQNDWVKENHKYKIVSEVGSSDEYIDTIYRSLSLVITQYTW